MEYQFVACIGRPPKGARQRRTPCFMECTGRVRGSSWLHTAFTKNIFSVERAKVRLDVDSREFFISRGVKQGDPLSAQLFITVLEKIMRKLKAEWKRLNLKRKSTKYGVVRRYVDKSTLRR